MTEKSNVFKKTYRDYLSQVARLNLGAVQETLGIQIDDGAAVIDFFGRPYRISPDGVFSPNGKESDFAISVVLFKYLLMCPEFTPRGDDWVSYKDFRDAAPFAGAFVNTTERSIAGHFARNLSGLRKACQALGGRSPEMDLAYDLSTRFDPLPRVPILMLFNDADNEFPAQIKLLFERRAQKYLDMECLAMLGMFLAEYLKRRG